MIRHVNARSSSRSKGIKTILAEVLSHDQPFQMFDRCFGQARLLQSDQVIAR